MRGPGGKLPGLGRAPLALRRQAERALARRRIAERTRAPLTPAQLAFDPSHHPRRTRLARVLVVLVVLLASAAVHGSVVGVGVLWSGFHPDKRPRRERLAIEMREHERERKPEEPKPDPAKPEPPPKVQERTPVVTRPAPRPAEVQPEQLPPAEPPRKGPPPRIAGISFEATIGGGDGPSFGVGNTHLGQTAERAVAPEDVAAKPAPTAPIAPTPAAPERPKNQVASRIPTAGVKYVLPKRKQPSTPAYPEALKAQGIEADVPVMVSIDATGKVTEVRILKPCGYPELDEAARKAALGETFEPALRDGVAVPYTLSFTYRFRLEDQ